MARPTRFLFLSLAATWVASTSGLGCGDDSHPIEELETASIQFGGDGFDDWSGVAVRGAMFVEGESEPAETAEATVSVSGGAWVFPSWELEVGLAVRLEVYLDVDGDGLCTDGEDVSWSNEQEIEDGATNVTLFAPQADDASVCAKLNELFPAD